MQDNANERAELETDSAVGQPATEQPAATQDTATQPSSTPEAGHGEAQDMGEPTSDVPAGDGNKEEPSVDILKKEYGKLKQVQQELKSTQQANETYRKYLLASPDRIREALIEVDGYTPEQADAYIQDLRTKNPQLWAQPQASTPTGGAQPAPTTVDPYKAAEEVLEKREMVKRFFQTLPDLNPEKITDPEAREASKELALRVDYLATALTQVDDSLSPEQAWSQAYKQITKKTDEEIAAAREAGRIEGMVARNTDQASTITPTTPGQTVNGTSPKLSEIERKVAREAGMTDEEYAKYRDQV